MQRFGDHELPMTAKIADRAYHLWRERGCQEGSYQQNRLEAERELLSQIADQRGGSIQDQLIAIHFHLA